MIIELPQKVIRKVRYLIEQRKRNLLTGEGIPYWEKRAKLFGAKSVHNLGNTDEEAAEIETMQRQVLFDTLQPLLRGHEQVGVDFGCGAGRFTPDLARTIQGRAIGVDPIKRLLKMAPASPNVEFRLIEDGKLPLETDSVDVMWAHSVLCILPDDESLSASVREMDRVVKPDGLFYIAENTSDRPDKAQMRFRSVETYQKFFAFVELAHIKDFYDRDERFSILAGRRR
ncbi:MAG: class I SAM-dependent methyltransferase [Verrucomicrobia bacterium]|nr:class I SAM-dependent methyltransferase [Verrucomicrobiota bacterium]